MLSSALHYRELVDVAASDTRIAAAGAACSRKTYRMNEWMDFEVYLQITPYRLIRLLPFYYHSMTS